MKRITVPGFPAFIRLSLVSAFGWLLLAGGGVASGQVFTDDFDSLSAGSPLSAQGWTTVAGAGSAPGVLAGPAGSVDTSVVIGVGSVAVSESSAALFSAGAVTSSSLVTLQFDVYSGGNGAIDLFGIGGAGSVGPSFGIYLGAFAIRGQSYSTLVDAVNSSGANVTAITGDWYRVMSVWNLATNTGSLYVENLTAGATSFTELFFDQAQTQTTAALGNTVNASTWTTAYLRTGVGTGSNVGYLDNLSVTVVPEPATWALALGGLALMAARLRCCGRLAC